MHTHAMHAPSEPVVGLLQTNMDMSQAPQQALVPHLLLLSNAEPSSCWASSSLMPASSSNSTSGSGSKLAKERVLALPQVLQWSPCRLSSALALPQR